MTITQTQVSTGGSSQRADFVERDSVRVEVNTELAIANVNLFDSFVGNHQFAQSVSARIVFVRQARQEQLNIEPNFVLHLQITLKLLVERSVDPTVRWPQFSSPTVANAPTAKNRKILAAGHTLANAVTDILIDVAPILECPLEHWLGQTCFEVSDDI